MVASAMLFWWSVLAPLGRPRIPRLATALLLFFVAAQGGILGALITLAPRPWYPFYVAAATSVGVPALRDQQLAGLLMWIPPGGLWPLPDPDGLDAVTGAARPQRIVPIALNESQRCATHLRGRIGSRTTNDSSSYRIPAGSAVDLFKGTDLPMGVFRGWPPRGKAQCPVLPTRNQLQKVNPATPHILSRRRSSALHVSSRFFRINPLVDSPSSKKANKGHEVLGDGGLITGSMG